MARILIVDHSPERRSILCTFLRTDEHLIKPVSREAEAIKAMRETPPDLIVLEGTVGGTKVMPEAKELDPGTAIIMLMGGEPSVEQLVDLMNQGVNDVLISPLDINDVQTKVERALSRRQATDSTAVRFHDLVGSSQKMQQVFRKLLKAAAVDYPVLIVGESGTGKRLVAEQIHRLSSRKDRDFRTIYCAGLSAHELESEFFGHEEGAFSWAAQRHAGQLELGDGGSLYLDGIAQLTLPIQSKLLRYLEDQTMQRFGGTAPLTANTRILAGVSQPLLHQVEEGSFRSDFFYRLSSCQIDVPPLRARAEDIPELVDYFLASFAVQIAGEAMEILMNYGWPGNVDELKNVVEQAVNLCESNRVELKDLPARVLKAVAMGSRRHKFIPRSRGK